MMKVHSLSSSPVTRQNPSEFLSSSQLSSRARVFISTNSFGFAPSSSSSKKKLSLKCRQSEYFDQQQRFSTTAAPNNPSPAPQAQAPAGGVTASSPRFFVGHSVYKGKAALTVEPKAPVFTALDSGAFKLSREGFVLLQFAPAAGVRVYDWGRKQVFSLSVTEIGSLISLGSKESFELFHDPFKGKSDEGKVRKVLKVEPLPDGSGHFFNLSVQNKLINLDESIYIPITIAEFAVLRAAFNFILPYVLGWHAYANSIRPEDSSRANNSAPKYGGDFEWSR